MIWIILLIVFLIFVFAFRDNVRKEPVFTIFMALGISIITLTLPIVILVCAIWNFTSDDVDLNQNLQAINDGTSIHGEFFLGSGVIDSEPSYYFYQQDNDGSFHYRSIEAYRARVFETNETPHIIRHCDDYNDTPKWIAWPLTPTTDDSLIVCDERSTIDFYIPEGSISNSFNMDLEN